MAELEKAVIKMIWDDVKNLKDDGFWRNYSRNFTYEHKQYKVKSQVKVNNQYFTYRNLSIEYAVQIIDIAQSKSLH